MVPSLFSGQAPGTPQAVLTTLQLGFGGARLDRKPRWYEVDRIELKQVRPLVEVGQVSVQLQVGPQQKPLWLNLEWLERWGGTFGPRSSQVANRRKAELQEEPRRYLRCLDEKDGTIPLDPEAAADRGGKPAWLLYLSCPRCARRCRVLYSRRGQHQYGCPKCEPVAYRRETWSVSGADRSPWAQAERQRRKHEAAADRIRRGYLNYEGSAGGCLLRPATESLPKPPRMTWARYQALARLVEAHETLALMASVHQLEGLMRRLMGAPTLETRRQQADMQRWALAVLRLDSWALRQRSWHRKGKPNDHPTRAARAKLAKMAETSAEGSGHAQEITA